MITNIPPRFIVIDDKKEHFEPIVEAFKEMGTSCNGVQYDEENRTHLNPLYYKGVRFLFTDLHLNPTGSSEKSHYGTIISILEEVVNKENGPYILVLWTAYPDKCMGLKDYIEEYINSNNSEGIEKNHWRPIYITSLAKEKYGINENSKISYDKIKLLQDDIQRILNSIPQLNLLFQWESDIITSAAKTINEIISLNIEIKEETPSINQSNTHSKPSLDILDDRDIFYKNNISKLDTIFSHIAKETVGESHVSSDPKKSFNLSVLPILFDNILNAKDDKNETFWNEAITRHTEKTKITHNKDIGKFNRILHLSLSENESIRETDWGAVIELSETYSKELCENLFQIETITDLFNKEFNICGTKINLESIKIKPILVRVGAACDYAQNKELLIPYIIGYKISSNDFSSSMKEKLNKLDKEQSLWLSPLFYQENGNEELFYILLKLPLKIMLKKDFFEDKSENITISYRIREQLLTHLIHNIANYSSRVGFNQLR